MKKILLIAVFCFSLAVIRPVKADFEVVELVLNTLEAIQKKAEVLQNVYQKVEMAKNAVRTGDFGALANMAGYGEEYQQFETAKNAVKNKDVGTLAKSGGLIASALQIDKVSVKMPQKIADNVQDTAKLEKSIEEETIAQYVATDQTKADTEHKMKNQQIMRENLARLYAYAFTLRSKKAKDRMDGSENEGSGEEEIFAGNNTREIMKLLEKEARESAYCLNRIVDMQSSRNEFKLRFIASTLQAKTTKEDTDKE